MPAESRELIFPLRGISEGWSFGRQPEATCPDAQNVVPIDALGSRIRGGQRWGLSKYYAAQHNGANALQGLTSVSLSLTRTNPVLLNPFTAANGYLYTRFPTQFDHYIGDTWVTKNLFNDGVIAIDADSPLIAGNQVQAIVTATNTTTTHIYRTVNVEFPGSYSTSMKITRRIPNPTNGTEQIVFYLAFRVNPAYNNELYTVQFAVAMYGPDHATHPSTAIAYTALDKWDAGGGYTTVDSDNVVWGDYSAAMYAAFISGATVRVSVTHAGVVTATIDGFGSYEFDTAMDSYGAYNRVGFVLEDEIGYESLYDDFTINGMLASSSLRDFKLIAVSGGDIYTGRPAGSLTLATTGENVVATSGRIDLQPAYGKTYFCDGTATGYRVLDNDTDTVSAWTPTGGALPVGTDDVTKACRMIALYRGRIVMAGLQEFPHNWYMSKVNDPLDWDYGATTSAIMAVAGNSTDAGECPDIITCLAPFSDDLMYIGGDHTLWVMTGDPADRGRLDNISEQIGVAGPDSFTFDPNGIFFFFGMGTIWKMVPGGIPEPISRNRLDTTFSAIDLTSNTVHLHWDNVRHGLFIFVVPSAEGATTHYYWDQQSDSFWKIAFPNAMGPTTAYPYDGDNPNDNALLLGGWDGYIRQIDAAAVNDDGTAINSYILYPPIAVGGPERNTRINRILSILDSNSDDVTLTAYAEDTVQRVIEATTIRFIHTLKGGRTTILKRIAGNAIMLKLSNETLSKTWAIENLLVNIAAVGKTRKDQL